MKLPLGFRCECAVGGPWRREPVVITTIGGLRRHAQKCEVAAAKLRQLEDRDRLDGIDRAKSINKAAR
jgi:hypothetical protein